MHQKKSDPCRTTNTTGFFFGTKETQLLLVAFRRWAGLDHTAVLVATVLPVEKPREDILKGAGESADKV